MRTADATFNVSTNAAMVTNPIITVAVTTESTEISSEITTKLITNFNKLRSRILKNKKLTIPKPAKPTTISPTAMHVSKITEFPKLTTSESMTVVRPKANKNLERFKINFKNDEGLQKVNMKFI